MHNLEQSCRGPDDNQEGFNTIRNITNEVNICYSLNSCEIPENEYGVAYYCRFTNNEYYGNDFQ